MNKSSDILLLISEGCFQTCTFMEMTWNQIHSLCDLWDKKGERERRKRGAREDTKRLLQHVVDGDQVSSVLLPPSHSFSYFCAPNEALYYFHCLSLSSFTQEAIIMRLFKRFTCRWWSWYYFFFLLRSVQPFPAIIICLSSISPLNSILFDHHSSSWHKELKGDKWVHLPSAPSLLLMLTPSSSWFSSFLFTCFFSYLYYKFKKSEYDLMTMTKMNSWKWKEAIKGVKLMILKLSFRSSFLSFCSKKCEANKNVTFPFNFEVHTQFD